MPRAQGLTGLNGLRREAAPARLLSALCRPDRSATTPSRTAPLERGARNRRTRTLEIEHSH